MKIELLGPYRDTATGHCVDEDLIRIGMTQHRICEGGRITVGHCRYTDGSILLFRTLDLSEREKDAIIQWTKELIRDHQQGVESGRHPGS